uniref:Uncharacterized protein n=1 Tax=Candidatus Kentrum sp. LFY TaxID=2126342 RepID=A0A450UTN6_9GAMM|nr:MAG: hypothetical protein BECKLFY1418A_GA0070994_105324 [Candidatus Kentron sp. LFY]
MQAGTIYLIGATPTTAHFCLLPCLLPPVGYVAGSNRRRIDILCTNIHASDGTSITGIILDAGDRHAIGNVGVDYELKAPISIPYPLIPQNIKS